MTLLYNDRYHTLLTGRGTDPCAFLGKPFHAVWPEVWKEVEPMLASTMLGMSHSYEDRRLLVIRNGVPDEMFVSFSTSPVFDGERNIGGVLCICSETSDRVRTRVGDASAATAQAAMRILVADDNVDAAETLSRLLQLQGHMLTVAHDGEQAVRLAAEGSYDVIVLDIGMPVMDGYQAAQALRSMPQTSATCLLALTGWGAEEDRARARAAGFDHHLLKPAQLSEIQNILAQNLSGRC